MKEHVTFGIPEPRQPLLRALNLLTLLCHAMILQVVIVSDH
jgi:hypothetical protein